MSETGAIRPEGLLRGGGYWQLEQRLEGHALVVITPPPSPCASNAHVQATPGVGSVNFRTMDLVVHFSVGPTGRYVCCLIR